MIFCIVIARQTPMLEELSGPSESACVVLQCHALTIEQFSKGHYISVYQNYRIYSV